MDYKKIFRSSHSRAVVLHILRFLPDTLMLKLQYRIKLGRKLDLKNPLRFTEKLQWYKIYYRDELMRKCVDKYHVREYVASKGLEQCLIPLIAHYESLSEVKWDELPEQFVIKTSHGGGGLNIVICKDKKLLDYNEINSKLYFEKKPCESKTGGREWAYYGLMPSIIVEELLVNETNPEAGVNDYKFFCFNGKADYIIVDTDRYIGHKRNFYDRNWNNLHITSDCLETEKEIPRPENLEEMFYIAEKLSSDFPFVRVDLYNVHGKIYFGELTFYPWSGYVQFNPDQWDYKFGEQFELIEHH